MNTYVLIGVALSASLASAEITCDLKRMDECTKDILPYSWIPKLGITKQQIAADCVKANNALKCLKEISDSGCVKSGIASGVYKLVLEGVERVNQGRCDEKHPKHADYLKNVECLNGVGEAVKQCMHKMTATTEAAQKQPTNERVARTCCAFEELDKCVREVARNKCSAEHADYVSYIVNGVAEDATETICTKFRGDACKKLSPIKVSDKTKYDTLVPPVIEILAL